MSATSFSKNLGVALFFPDEKIKNSVEEWYDIERDSENELIVDIYSLENETPEFIETIAVGQLVLLSSEFYVKLEEGKKYYLMFKVINCFSGKVKYISPQIYRLKKEPMQLSFYSLKTFVEFDFDKRLPDDTEMIKVKIETYSYDLNDRLFYFENNKIKFIEKVSPEKSEDEISINLLGATSTIKENNPENFEMKKAGFYTEKMTVFYYFAKPGQNYEVKKVSFDLPLFYRVKIMFVPSAKEIEEIRESEEKPFLKIVPIIFPYG